MSTPMPRPRTLLAMGRDTASRIVDDDVRARLDRVADVVPGIVADDFSRPETAAALGETEVLLTGWGCAPLDATVIDRAPRLRAIVHTAGSVKPFVTDACWDRGISVSSAAWANALPVAEYTVAAVLMSNKRMLHFRDALRAQRARTDWYEGYSDVGNYRRTIGVIGASRIGRRVIELLRPYDLTVRLYDPYLPADEADALGVRAVGLDELCATSDVVSVHAPELPTTRRMLDRRRLALMRDGATLINTARGSLIDTKALVEELVTGRLHAVLDVTDPDPLTPDSPLFDLPNVLLTPHIAGSMGTEMRRMADSAVDELARYAAGLPFAHPVLRDELDRAA
ncbi:hydroxyacid dehydrogenase [Streptomyces sp. RB6PN25]|uniref:Hydroxyacid dehydrogenase n=1 Tax=Streptomyces humicola TaxID=2953240 RepID=A0ABT1Q839_9ACTN|nr:hydroxyacid dehydrogenase [Streptomyces humicola]MCQ4084995.1 hydroxyacid dehydrogenase [Streptomyces humicola]